MSDLVGNTKDLFSRVAAQIGLGYSTLIPAQLCGVFTPLEAQFSCKDLKSTQRGDGNTKISSDS